MLTAKGLVAHCIMAHVQAWGYVWGTYGLVLTENGLTDKYRQYPEEVGKFMDFIPNKWIGKRTVDCSGLIKSYLWWNNGLPKYDPRTDLSANMLFRNAVEKNSFASEEMPDIPGILVFKPGHVGVYIGDGWVIEAKGTKYGVVKSYLPKGNWISWAKCHLLDYRTPAEKKDWTRLVMEASDGFGEKWIKTIETLADIATDHNTSIGDLSIMKNLPELIEKIGNKEK